MEKIKQNFIDFVNLLDDRDLEGMCESRQSIGFTNIRGFYVAPTDFIQDSGDWSGEVVYDSEGQADYPISNDEMKAILIANAEDLLQGLYYA